jgi:hypothetical protein
MAATAQPDGRASREIERVPFGIVNREIAFDADRAVVENDNFRWH